MTRRGMTLLEVLLALSLLAMMAALSGSWMVTASRTSMRTQEQAEALAQWQALVSLLREDVGLKIGERANAATETPDILRLTTLHRTPGQEPGFTTVEYQVDQNRHLVIRRAVLLGHKLTEPGAERLVTTAIDVTWRRMGNGGIALYGGPASGEQSWHAQIGGDR